MKRPMWTHPIFAGFVAVAFLVAARFAMKAAVVHGQLKVDPLARLEHDNTRAALLVVLAMLLVIWAIVVPLVIRKKAQRRLSETAAPKPEKLGRMIIGAHSIIYSQRPEADRAFLRDV